MLVHHELYLLRTWLMNCCMGLTRSVLNDYVRKAARAGVPRPRRCSRDSGWENHETSSPSCLVGEAPSHFEGGETLLLDQGVLERRERLEQLRALENGLRVDVARVDTMPLGVDTPSDLERARADLSAS